MFGLKNPANPEAEMGFFDHLEALRWHLIRSAIAIVACASFVGIFYDFVFDKIILGIQSKDFPTYRLLCWISTKVSFAKDICIDHDMKIPLQNTAMFGQVTLLFQYSIIIGLVMAFPYIIWELWRFVAPALKPEEAKKTSRVILACSAFFFAGVLFCYFIIIPFSINFAVNFTISPSIHNNFTIDNYIDFFSVMLLAIGLVFELPMIVYFLSKIGILKPATMRKSRRYAILIIAIVAGVITPSPDVFTQCLVAVPIYILFEISIMVSARIEKQNLRKSS
ncbi:MAG: Sec-independent protein translocase, TatC subunit [Bacteroidota bacterium]|nr:Sec-independent protein translocase, TatC subunit [Bacteroidota bacterium]